jgi:hypothetical protein
LEGSVTDEVAEKAPEPKDELLELVLSQFEEFADASLEGRRQAEKCRAYKDGDQYTDEERAVYKKRKQPCITDNKIQDKCDTLAGIEKQQRTDPKAFPRTPDDEKSAEAATDALRFVADQSLYKQTCRKPALDNLMIEGLCVGQVVVEKRKGQQPKICMEHVRWDRAYYDIHSLKEDFQDKTYCGMFTWMDVDVAKGDFPGKEETIDECFTPDSAAGPDQTHDDKPRYVLTTSKRKRVQVFKTYFLRKGKWHECVWVKGGFLEEPKPAAYKDEFGQPACCMEFQALYRDSEGTPYGTVKRYLDLQDEHNRRRSKMLHLLNSKRIVVGNGTFDDINKARAELHKPDGVIEFGGDLAQLRIEDNLNEAEGQWRLLQQTDQSLSQVGPNAAIEGTSGSISGIAKARDQQAGSLSISPLFEALDAWEMRIYRQAWNRIRQYWKAEMWVRVTDDEDKAKFVILNQPMLQGDLIAEQMKSDPAFQQASPEEQQAAIQELAQHPQAQMPVIENGKPKKKNDVAAMDVDIIIDRGQDTVTVQQEEFAILAEIAKGRQEIPFKTIIEMSQLRPQTKKKAIDSMSGADDPAAQAMAQMQQRMADLEAQLKEAAVMKTLSEVKKNEAAAGETEIDSAVKIATFTSPTPEGEGKPASKSQVNVN